MSDLILLLPFVALLVLNILPRSTRTHAWIVAAVVFALQTAAAILQPFGVIDWSFLDSIERSIGFTLKADNLAVLLMLTAGIAGLASMLVASASGARPRAKYAFANLALIALIGINGISMVRDLFSLYVFIEVTSVAAFIMVAVRDEGAALEGAWKYLLLSAVASVLMLASVAFFLLTTGGVSFNEIASALAAPTPEVWIAAALFLCGMFVKSAMVPFHGWLADAYTEAPPAVSVFLAGIVTKASGIFAVMRLAPMALTTAGPGHMILLVVGAATAVVGALLSLTQTDMKRMLAWSSVSQMGYIVMALGGQPALALAAAAVHFFNHTVSKAQLFTNAAAVEARLGTRDMDRMGGLGSRMPVTSATSAVAALSIAGLPPLAGFWSKLLIVLALWNAGQVVFAVIAVLTSLVTLAYFLALQRKVFFGTVLPEWSAVREAGPGYLVPSLALAAITVAVGLGFPFLLPILLGGGA
jgi:proton-translocating NADH-quinone oxidoreductase chain N